jgi:hypothetical protein
VLGFNLRRYDEQARFGVILSLASVGSLLVLMFFVFRHLKWSEWVIYGSPTRQKLIYAAGALTMALATAGFGFGLNSAGQKRNDKPLLSWIGFFVGGAVLCLAIVILFFFYKQFESTAIGG